MTPILPPDLSNRLGALSELVGSTKGFMPRDEGMALALSLYNCDLDARYPAVEIGSYIGLSTIYLGTAAKLQSRALISVDHHRGSEENQIGWQFHDKSLVDPVSQKIDTLYLFRRTIELADLSETVVIIVADSQRYAAVHKGEIGYLFIDGGHGETQAHQDFDSWVPKIKVGGILAIHDVFEDPADGGRPPFELFQRSLQSGFVLTSIQGSLRVLVRATL